MLHKLNAMQSKAENSKAAKKEKRDFVWREEEEEELALSGIKNKHINHRLFFRKKNFFLLLKCFIY